MTKKITHDPIYDSSQRVLVSIEEIRGVIQFRELIIQLIRRDTLMRYKSMGNVPDAIEAYRKFK